MKHGRIVLPIIFFSFFYTPSYGQNIGIGTTMPAGKLTIGHNSTGSSPGLIIYDSTSISRLQFRNAGTTKYWEIRANSDNTTNTNSKLFLTNSATGFNTMAFDGSGEIGIGTDLPFERIDIHTNMNFGGGALLKFNYSPGIAGNVLTSNGASTPTWQALPIGSPNPAIGFSARLSANNTIPNYTFTSLGSFIENFDDGGNNFNPGNGIFTAPSPGLYQFSMSLNWQIPLSGESKVVSSFYVNGIPSFYAVNTFGQGDPGPGTGQGAFSVDHSYNVKLNIGDQVKITVNVLNSSQRILEGGNTATGSIFSGFKVY